MPAPVHKFTAVPCAGIGHDYMIILTGVSVCGYISDGVSISFSNISRPTQAEFVVSFQALERAYLANLKFRKNNPEAVASAERLGEQLRKLP